MLALITVAGGLTSATAIAGVEETDAPGIENFSRIEGSVGLADSLVGFGGPTQPSAMAWLKSQGFATVINLRLATEEDADVDDSRAAAQAAGLKYIHVPLNPKEASPDDVDGVVSALADAANQPVYIHCGTATRAAALWMIARVREDGWNIDAAFAEAEVIAAKPDDALAFATRFIAARQE